MQAEVWQQQGQARSEGLSTEVSEKHSVQGERQEMRSGHSMVSEIYCSVMEDMDLLGAILFVT
jgi:hypothetical protein